MGIRFRGFDFECSTKALFKACGWRTVAENDVLKVKSLELVFIMCD